MTKILVLRPTVASGKDLEVNRQYDVSEKDARLLIALRKAQLAEDKPAGKKKSDKGDGGSAD